MPHIVVKTLTLCTSENVRKKIHENDVQTLIQLHTSVSITHELLMSYVQKNSSSVNNKINYNFKSR